MMSAADAHTPVSTPDYKNRAGRWGGAISTSSSALATHTARLAKAAGTCHSLPRPNPFCHTVPYLQGLCALTCAARVTFAWKSSHELNLPCSHNTPCHSVISAPLHRHSLQFKTSTAQFKCYTLCLFIYTYLKTSTVNNGVGCWRNDSFWHLDTVICSVKRSNFDGNWDGRDDICVTHWLQGEGGAVSSLSCVFKGDLWSF